jgi:osmotically inducible protein OsmC
MATERKAEVTWQGSLTEGKGTIVSTTTGAIGEQPVSWPARAEDPTGGTTSPEELLAAAHAACFAMALSNELTKAGHVPQDLRVRATVTFQPGEGITRIRLETNGIVPGADADAFEEAARAAKTGCPISKALAGVPEIDLDIVA